jgi:hypothetical protein
VLEANKALYSLNDGYSPSREWKRAASIPMAVIEKWKSELGVDFFNPNDRPRVYALLDSHEYLYLRTAPGRLSRGPHREYLQRVQPLVLPNGWERGRPLMVA